MLSRNAWYLASLLREELGSDVKGVGVETAELVNLWGDYPPEDLQPTIKELERIGYIRVERTIPPQDRPGVAKEYNLRNIVGIQITEALQQYMDRIEA
ncbi:hypothetical protein MO867_19465 [Microbulbifer sp. OS29]|uniref:Uncharacterized protein n=1 Tax=Microbulbifer okhotskensis TaxID=2926617 RepID=A0A9X2ESC0_9GAMM|nr:hypothetical protein [Microbulbifer okhotskensis]MCO1336515.1 hypothetical protein [Microbulbifer okhotskensis]